jgi:hypothetical protein
MRTIHSWIGAVGVVAMAVMIGACGSAPKAAPITQSRALRAAVIQTLDDAMAQQTGAANDKRPSMADPALAKSVADAIEAQFPQMFQVTTIQEKQFQDGKFDDEGNLTRLGKLIDEARRLNTKLPTLTAELIRQHEAGQLKGLKLELAVRLLAAQNEAAALGGLQAL